MYLLGNLLVAFAPSLRHPKAPAYWALVRETRAYDPWLDDYEPYAANHESPAWTSTPQRARIVYERVMAAEAGRRPKTLAFLERNGFHPTVDPATWDALGEWLADNVEGSREPGSDRYSPLIRDYPGGRAPTSVAGVSTAELRPKLNGLAFDLGLLLGRRMIEAAPGARWASESELTGEDSLVAEPRIVLANGVNFYTPLPRVLGHLRACLVVKLGLVAPHDRLRLGDALRAVLDPVEVVRDDPDPRESFLEHLRLEITESGKAPNDADIGEMLFEYGLEEMPPLPPDLARLMDRPAPAAKPIDRRPT